MALHFFFEDCDTFKLERRKISGWIKKVVEIEAFKIANVSIIFCSDPYLLKINQNYLNHDYYTDIITFDYSNGTDISGDLFISVDTVRSNAEDLNVEFVNELHRVIIHGILHLIGYKDKSDRERIVMRSKEDKYLEIFK